MFINGLKNKAGWAVDKAEEHFTQLSPMYEIGNVVDFILVETKRLRFQYPKITISPLIYLVEDNKFYIIKE